MKKFLALVLALVLVLSLSVSAIAASDEKTVTYSSGTSTSNKGPFDVYNSDTLAPKCQLIYWQPADATTGIAKGMTLTAMDFYPYQTSFDGNAKWKITVMEVSDDFNFDQFASGFVADTSATVGWDNKALPAISGNKITIPFDTPCRYNGGYLLITASVTQKSTTAINNLLSFYGYSYSGYTGRSVYYASTKAKTEGIMFLPKVTFTYKHIHGDWVYSADGATLTATCGVGACTDPATSASLTVSADESCEYGSTIDPELSDSTAWAALGLDVPTISCTYSATVDGVYAVTEDLTRAGYYQASISAGANDKKKTATATFTITPKSISSESVVVAEIDAQKHTGNAVCPVISVKDGGTDLMLDRDYTVEYENNIDVGEGTVTITGIGNYTGTTSANFAIEGYSVSVDEEIANGKVSVDLNKAVVGTVVTVTAEPDKGYKLSSITVHKVANPSSAVSVKKDGTFEMPAFDVVVCATFAKESIMDKPMAIINGIIEKTNDQVEKIKGTLVTFISGIFSKSGK